MRCTDHKGALIRLLVPSSILLLVLGAMAAQAQERVIYSFTTSNPYPTQTLVADAAGNLYGTVLTTTGNGEVVEVSPSSSGTWTEKTLFTFNGSNGHFPQSSLLVDSKGNLYGTTLYGGNGPCMIGTGAGCGVVFELVKSSTGAYSERLLHQFQGFSTDGSIPAGALAMDGHGNIYGSTEDGGGIGCSGGVGCGTVYELKRTTKGFKEQILHKFNGTSDGSAPIGVTLMGTSLYGVADLGGFSNAGTVFKLTLSNGTVTFSNLHSFTRGSDGGFPVATVTLDPAGNIYGTTTGNQGQSGWGNVFELANSNGQYTFSTLYTFTGGSDGASPSSTLTRDSAGNLYSTTFTGGITSECSSVFPGDGCGVVFKLTPPAVNGNPWTETVLDTFSDAGTDGDLPEESGVIFGQGGLLYGTTEFGGTGGCQGVTEANCGTVYEITP